MKKNTQQWYVTIFTILSTCVVTSVFAAPLDILAFQKKKITSAEQKYICTQTKKLCENPEQWRSLTTDDQKLWLLADNSIAVFTPSQAGLKLIQQWQLDLTSNDEYEAQRQFIYPKLFPMAQHQYAIAIIDTVSEMYSGGGANIERANFYELKNDGRIDKFIENYPFSFNRMIRACFSEQDYESSKGNCHDEAGLSLDIRPIKPMQWQLIYRYQLSVSPASDLDEKSYKGTRKLMIDLNHVPKQPNIPELWNYAGADSILY